MVEPCTDPRTQNRKTKTHKSAEGYDSNHSQPGGHGLQPGGIRGNSTDGCPQVALPPKWQRWGEYDLLAPAALPMGGLKMSSALPAGCSCDTCLLLVHKSWLLSGSSLWAGLLCTGLPHSQIHRAAENAFSQ